MLTIPRIAPTTIDKIVSCKAGEFHLLCRMPSYKERLEDDARGFRFVTAEDPGKAYAEQVQNRLYACVTGWTGLRDEEGKEVPFTIPALIGVLTLFPDAAVEVSELLQQLYAGDPKQLGELFGPRNGSGGKAAPTTCPTSSTTTSNGEKSPTVPAPSV